MRFVLNNFCHVFTQFDLRERFHGPYSDTRIAFKYIYIYIYIYFFFLYLNNLLLLLFCFKNKFD